MAGPITNDYISATCKSFISNDNDGKMIENNFIEIEGTFLVKIRDNAFNGNDGENVFKHINSFLKVAETHKVRGLSHDRFRLSVFAISLSGAASEWFRNECVGTISTWDDLVENFVQKFYNLFDHNEEIKTYDENEQELNNDKTQGLDEQWPTNGVPFKNFHELDYNVLVKLEECWWKVNIDEVFPFTRNYETNNYEDMQGGQRCMEDLDHEPSACKIKRFEMTKYTFETDEEFIEIKELEHITVQKPIRTHVIPTENFFAKWTMDGS
ncbi:hypothetical protein Tco_1289274 [Tanacetum coccineum]